LITFEQVVEEFYEIAGKLQYDAGFLPADADVIARERIVQKYGERMRKYLHGVK
jgi:hypothetical protein